MYHKCKCGCDKFHVKTIKNKNALFCDKCEKLLRWLGKTRTKKNRDGYKLK